MAMPTLLKRLWCDERGATAVEYGLIVSMIVLAMIAALQDVASEIISTWEFVEDEVSAV